MKKAVIDIVVELLPKVIPVLADAGLRVVGSLVRGLDPNDQDQVRLIICDDNGSILPDRCATEGWWQVTVVFQQESYGRQVITRLQKVDLVGRLVFSAATNSKIEAA